MNKQPYDPLDPESQMVWPFAPEAEKGVLCCLFNDTGLIPEARVMLKDECFYQRPHLIVWQMICELDQHGKPVDLATVTNALRERDLLEQAGGPGAISELFTFIPATAHFSIYVTTLREKKLLRDTATLCRETLQKIHWVPEHGAPEEVGVLVATHEAAAFALVEQSKNLKAGLAGAVGERKTINQTEAWDAFTLRIERAIRNRGAKKTVGIQTGWHDVDRAFGGLCVDPGGDLWIIGGKPGQGKSIGCVSLLEQIAINQHVPTHVFPLEMGEAGFSDRLNLGAARVDTSKTRSGFFSRKDQQDISLLALRAEHTDAPIRWDHRSFITTTELRAEVQISVRKHGTKCVIIDHMGQIKPVGKEARKDMRLGIIEVMETLHAMRRDFGILIILAVQLAKDADKKAGGALPQLSDLRGAAEIEEYATQVLFIHRPCMYRPWVRLKQEARDEWERLTGYYIRNTPENWASPQEVTDVARVNYEEHTVFCIRKNRHGPTPDDLCMRFQGSYQRFTNRTASLYSNNEDDRQVRLVGFS